MLVATIKESPTFRNYGCDKLPMMSVMKLCVCVCVCGGVRLHEVNAPSPDVVY